jgi:hypothetical protein
VFTGPISLVFYLDLPSNELQAITPQESPNLIESRCECCSVARVGGFITPYCHGAPTTLPRLTKLRREIDRRERRHVGSMVSIRFQDAVWLTLMAPNILDALE